MRISPHLVRGPNEPVDDRLAQFYARLLAVLRQPTLRDGRWSLLECVRVWHDNASSDNFIAFHWERNSGESLCVVVNYAAQQSQCFVRMPFPDLAGRSVRFQDQLGPDCYDRPGDDVLNRGLFVDMPAWGHHAFDVQWLA